MAGVRTVRAVVSRPCSACVCMHVARAVRETATVLIVLMLCACMLAALSLLVTMMWHHSECCVCMACVPTVAVHKETANEKHWDRRSDVAKLSTAVLNLRRGPVPGDRVRKRPAGVRCGEGERT